MLLIKRMCDPKNILRPSMLRLCAFRGNASRTNEMLPDQMSPFPDGQDIRRIRPDPAE